METTIKRKVSGKLMMKIFKKDNSIRHYKTNETDRGVHQQYWYNVKVRHNEDQNAGKVFDDLRNKYK